MAHDRDEVALAPGMDFQDGEAIVGIVEGDALDRACERLECRPLIHV